MGGSTFFQYAESSTATEAFRLAVQDAQYEYGHAGYTGSIAEKDGFRKIELPEGREPREYAEELISNNDPRIDDKWGPAGCIQLPIDNEKRKELTKKCDELSNENCNDEQFTRLQNVKSKLDTNKYLFFGWASS